MVEVTQEDREAYLAMNMLPEFDAADVRAGLWDKVTGLQAFARHRIAALELAAQVADRHDTGDCTREDMEARRIAAEIRAMKGPSNG